MAYKHNNEFLDKLRLSEPHIYLTDLRKIGAHLTRADLSNILGISHHSIRRYESQWENSNPPKWYELILRFLSGDLSYYGDYWHECRIHPFTCQLSTPFDKYNAYFPKDLHMQFNRIHRLNETELRDLRANLEQIKRDIQATKQLNALLQARIELLESENARLKARNEAEKSGKVIPLFRHKQAQKNPN